MNIFTVLVVGRFDGNSGVFCGNFSNFNNAIKAAKDEGMQMYHGNPTLVTIEWRDVFSAWGQAWELFIDAGYGYGLMSSGVQVVEMEVE